MHRAADLADANAELVDQALLLLRTLLANKSPPRLQRLTSGLNFKI